jgi:hypothetical protein
MSEWIPESKPPRFDSPLFAQVWLDDDSVRLVRRVGNDSRSITPGEFVYTDTRHPLAQAIYDLDRVMAWRPVSEQSATPSRPY